MLSEKASAVWAKAGKSNGDWLPLAVHMYDSAVVAAHLWDSWISPSVKEVIEHGINAGAGTDGRSVLTFLAAVHDIGKAVPAFQYMDMEDEAARASIVSRLAGEGLRGKPSTQKINHSLMSQLVLKRCGFHRSAYSVVGSHHGWIERDNRKDLSAYPLESGSNDDAWNQTREELVGFCASLSGSRFDELAGMELEVEVLPLLSGLVIMADWLASNELLFPYGEWDCIEQSALDSRKDAAVRTIRLMSSWRPVGLSNLDYYREIFGFSPRPFQLAVGSCASEMQEPGLMIIEAPMGEGKTEAAFLAAETMAGKFGKTGLFFALPTQATSNAVFKRMVSWLRTALSAEDMHTASLVHGKSLLNETYQGMEHYYWSRESVCDDLGGDALVVNEWMTGRKKSMLADFAVGTIDQVLMMALVQKHVTLRHLSLANKVVVIDECHSYDEYMGEFLQVALTWFGAYRIPVVMMSATLSQSLKAKYVSAYTGGSIDEARGCLQSSNYPCITICDKGVSTIGTECSSRRQDVGVGHITDEGVIPSLSEGLSQGGVAGIIVNSVSRAQRISAEVSAVFGKDRVKLLHSRFTDSDRSMKESDILSSVNEHDRMDPGKPLIVVGTQVIEQSLDLDFDMLITDICPIDLFMQRVGRLHRHERARSARLMHPFVSVVDSEEALRTASAIYNRYQIMNSVAILRNRAVISIPDDIRGLVNEAYSEGGIASLRGDSEYEEARKEAERMKTDAGGKAKGFTIPRLCDCHGLGDIMSKDLVDGESAVRDIEPTFSAILVEKHADGSFHLLKGAGGDEIPNDASDDLLRKLAGCRVSIPARMGGSDLTKKPSGDGGSIPSEWRRSKWIGNESFVVMDEEQRSICLPVAITYSQDIGIQVR